MNGSHGGKKKKPENERLEGRENDGKRGKPVTSFKHGNFWVSMLDFWGVVVVFMLHSRCGQAK